MILRANGGRKFSGRFFFASFVANHGPCLFGLMLPTLVFFERLPAAASAILNRAKIPSVLPY
jgi:hypothetical protein